MQVDGNYRAIKGDHIAYRYEILNEIGKGSFGQAIRCIDHKKKKEVCVKVVKQQKKFADQAKIEIKILEFIKDADPEDETNIVKIRKHFVFRDHVVCL